MGIVNILKPTISPSLYQTMGFSKPVPVNIPLTIKKGRISIKRAEYNLGSHIGLCLSWIIKSTKERLIKSSEWDFEKLKNKLVIELGSGAGRFTEILLTTGCYVISVEMSDAIYVNSKNNKSENIIFIKSSVLLREFIVFYKIIGFTKQIYHFTNPYRQATLLLLEFQVLRLLYFY